MVTALVLAGGSGSRMGVGSVPKQYLLAGGKPVIMYCLEQFQRYEEISDIVIVAEKDWHPFLEEWIRKCGIAKRVGFAAPGRSRQHSIYSGLVYMKQAGAGEEDIVVIHDAARPCVTRRIIEACISGAKEADGAMPVITVKDTVYKSRDGQRIDSLLNRDELFAGQAPESFRFGKYFRLHENMSDQEIGAVRGSSEIAYKNGLDICLVEGSEANYKITTAEDYEKFCLQVENGSRVGEKS